MATWLAKRPMRRPNSEGKSLQKVNGLVEILNISNENVDEDPEVRESVKDEGLIGKKMKETMLAKEPVKDDFEAKRMKTKSNQLAYFNLLHSFRQIYQLPSLILLDGHYLQVHYNSPF